MASDTAPDHTPYLLPTDLHTPEDVVRWQSSLLFEIGKVHDARLPAYYISARDIVLLSEERLDRERRQALRAGLRRAWLDAKFHRREERTAKRVLATPYQANIRAMMQLVIVSRSKRAECIQRALAFRAAARQP